MQKIRVLIADSQRLLADSLARSLRQLPDMDVLEEHPTTGMGAVDAVEIFRPDVVLLDYWLEGMLGPAAIRAIHSGAPDCKVIILSWFQGTREVENCLYAGAVGFLPKSLNVDHVASAIRLSIEGESPVYGDQLGELLSVLNQRERRASLLWARMKGLTRRELQILALLSLGRSLKEIGEELSITPKTARNYLNNMMAKSGAHSQTELLNLARDCGLIAG